MFLLAISLLFPFILITLYIIHHIIIKKYIIYIYMNTYSC